MGRAIQYRGIGRDRTPASLRTSLEMMPQSRARQLELLCIGIAFP
jgi:hypothetical protein